MRPPFRPTIAQVLFLLTLSAACGTFIHAVENLLVPRALQGAAQVFYRLVFWPMLPVRSVLTRLWEFDTPARTFSFWAPWAGALVPLLLWGMYGYVRWRMRERAAGRESQDTQISRRVFIARGSAAAFGVAAAGLGLHTTLVAPQRLRIVRYTQPIRDLPPALHGLRIAHVSDTHYGPYITLDYLESVVRAVNQLNADLVLLTGDYVHRTPAAIPEGIGLLRSFKSRLGSIAVLGNHDHWEGVERVRRRFQQVGVPLIDNSRLFVTPDGVGTRPFDGAICIGGVGDYWEDDVRPAQALREVPPRMPRLVLSHNPDVAELKLPAGLRIDLMLSGHTHGGQVSFPVIGTPMVPSAFGQKYNGGLVQGPHCPVIVSRGVGMAVLPLRLNCPPEIGLIELTAG